MEEECTCTNPGKETDFITAFAPVKGGGWKKAWYARKDCPLHGMKEISITDMPEPTTEQE
jgi:hypothetical protein